MTTRLRDLSLLSEQERRRILFDWNDTAADFPAHRCLHHLVEDQVARTPDAVAVRFEGTSMSYGELNRRANRVASELIVRGVKRQSLVGLYTRRSFEQIVGALAILKAGGAYVPLEPEYPEAALRHVINDAQLQIIVTERLLSDDAAARFGMRTFVSAENAAPDCDANPNVDVAPHDPVYVMYTSGSTGRPKGVVNVHRGLVNRIQWMRSTFDFTSADRVLHKTPFSFDVSVWELLLPLISGATLVIARPDAHRDPNELLSLIAAEQITAMHFVPSMLAAFLEAEAMHRSKTLRIVFSSGEALPVPLQNRFTERIGCTLVNLYGPTEASIDVTSWVCRRGDGRASVPLGRPIANTRIYILDERLEPVPVGVTGEIFIGGVGLAREYWRRPELTAERFRADPFVPGERIYATGDLGRFDRDGLIEFLGRKDDQIKLRGFRIELGEIELVLREHPAVREAAVVFSSDERRLKAFVAVRDDRSDGEALRAHLRAELPEHMVPTSVRIVSELPLTSNGKVDRKKLLELADPVERTSYEAPVGEQEEAVASAWSKLLHRERIGRHDHFFELGGDSITSIQVVAHLRRRGYELQVRDVFESPTVEALARAMRRIERKVEAERAVGNVLPLTAVQKRFVRRHGLTAAGQWQATVVDLDKPVDETSVRRLVERHVSLRLRFDHDRAYVGDGATTIIEHGIGTDPHERAVEIARRFDVARGPLFGAVIDDNKVLLVAHHLAVDAVTWRILTDELRDDSDDVSSDGYASVVERLAASASDPETQNEAEYWTKTAEAASAAFPLARFATTDRNTPERLMQHLDRERTRLLLERVPHAYRTRTDEVLLTALVRAAGGDLGVQIDGAVFYPVHLRATDVKDSGRSLKEIKETLRNVPRDGIAWSLLRELSNTPAAQSVRACREPQLRFVFLGSRSRWSRIVEEERDIDGVEITAEFVDGDLEVVWRWDSTLNPEEVERFAERFASSLNELIDRASRPGTFAYTPSDFPLAGLTQSEIDDLVGCTPGVADLYPLAPMQEGLLFRGMFLPESDSYLNQNVLKISGSLDERRLHEAWTAVADYYDILRTAFVWANVREPLQRVMRTVEVPWQSLEWRGCGDVRAQLDTFLVTDRMATFDPSKAPLFRLACARIDDDQWLLIWTHHHILIDGWCLSLIWGNVFRLYERLVAGGTVSLPYVRPYRDYIEWLRRQDTADAVPFWRTYLAGFERPTRFTTADNHLPSPYRTDIVRLSIEKTARLKRLAQETRTTLSSVVQAAWALLLGQFSQKRDVVYGISVAGRPPELDGSGQMVGLFTNTLPLRVLIDGSLAIGDLLRNLQQDHASMASYEYLPLAHIKTLTPAGSGGQPIFDSLIAFENYPEDSLPPEKLGGIEIHDLLAHEKTEYPIGLIVLPGPELMLHFNYDTALFSPERIVSIKQSFLHILDELQRAPATQLGALSLLSDDEWRRVTSEWNATERSYESLRAHELFERQVVDRRDEVAVADDHRQWTYAQLEEQANRIAHRLQRMGVREGSHVVVRVPRSIELIAAMLAIWKAGASYVPLDGGHPAERQRAILDDINPAVVISDRADGLAGYTVWVYDEADLSIERSERLPSAHGNDIAYVMYTSGTSGKPKGVLCTHAGLVNRVLWSIEEYPLRADDVLLHNAAVGFDIAVWEMLAPLAAGGSVAVLGEGEQRDMKAVAEAVVRHGVTTLHLVPSLLDLLLEEMDEQTVLGWRALRQVITGGEWAPSGLWKRFQRRLPGVRLHHAYGPTETTISVTHWECRTGEDEGRIPLGRPIANTRIYVLDAEQRPVPAGVEGEIYIGGVCLAAGYWRSEELTAEKFVLCRWNESERLYRSGDWGRLSTAGVLEYLGRRDRQVKVRGQRVELGEVEATLSALSFVKAAVVEAVEQSGDVRLQAWVVGDRGEKEAIEERAREELARKLPTHMVPSAIVVVDSFPLTVNGKIDRAALPRGQRVARQRAVQPRTSVEARLWHVWRTLLGRSDFGVEDDFFALGGHSLLAIRFVLHTDREFGGGALNITHIFKQPTIAKLARIVEGHVDQSSPLLVIGNRNASRRLFLVHPGEGLAYAYRGLGDHLKDLSVAAIHNPRFGQSRRFASVEEMASEYTTLIRTHDPNGPYLIGGWSFGGVVAFEIGRQLLVAGADVDAIVLIDSYCLSAFETTAAMTSDVHSSLIERGLDIGDPETALVAGELLHNGNLAVSYRPTPFDGRVILIRAEQEKGWRGSAALRNGWRDLVSGPIEVYSTAGTHAGLFSSEYLASTARAIKQALGVQ